MDEKHARLLAKMDEIISQGSQRLAWDAAIGALSAELSDVAEQLREMKLRGDEASWETVEEVIREIGARVTELQSPGSR